MNTKEPDELVFLAQNFSIQIPGFRKNSIPKNLNPKMLISTILKPENLKKLNIDNIESHEEVYKADSILNVTDLNSLQQLATKKYAPSKVLEILLINKKFEEATNLFNYFMTNYNENELSLLEIENIEDSEHHSMKNEENSKAEEQKEAVQKEENQNKVTKKLEEKITNLKEELKKAHSNNEQLKEELYNEKKEKNLEIQRLKTQNNDLQKIIESLNTKVSLLEESLFNSLQKEECLRSIIKKLENEKVEKIEKNENNEQKNNYPNITIIGTPSNSIINSCNIHFTVLDKKQALKIDLNNQDEIWILSYQVDKKIEKELKEAGLQKPIRLISTFLELKQAIQKETELHDKQSVGS
ncbi:hypothetical protein [Ureibacillus endophyticus]|uniref:hypothetical protein n=1 Tax=Ureibacillus endophyticus TaxID=1978490 RepID=UPI0011C464B5|nr:hypothetical protein [Lysinibacillus endophyticus]